MRVLVACEFSATVRDAFRGQGHDAWSADLLDTEGDPRWHFKGDVLDVLGDGWDLLVAHPPCTYLTYSGVRWLHTQPGRWDRMRDGAAFFAALLNAPVARVCVENPVMHGYGHALVGGKQQQIIQPWMFGHRQRKGTGLWLRNLPPLVPTTDLRADTMALPARERDAVYWAAPGPDRWRVRSRTFAGIAHAMATQWGSLTGDLGRQHAGNAGYAGYF